MLQKQASTRFSRYMASDTTHLRGVPAIRAEHFLQEDQAPAVAQHIAELVASTG